MLGRIILNVKDELVEEWRVGVRCWGRRKVIVVGIGECGCGRLIDQLVGKVNSLTCSRMRSFCRCRRLCPLFGVGKKKLEMVFERWRFGRGTRRGSLYSRLEEASPLSMVNWLVAASEENMELEGAMKYLAEGWLMLVKNRPQF